MPADKSVEWLKYEFADQTPSSAVVQLEWEKLIIPFKIDVDVVNTQLASFRRELRSDKGFTWENWDQAASFCAQHKPILMKPYCGPIRRLARISAEARVSRPGALRQWCLIV